MSEYDKKKTAESLITVLTTGLFEPSKWRIGIIDLFFALNSLYVIREEDSLTTEAKEKIIEVIYSLLCTNDKYSAFASENKYIFLGNKDVTYTNLVFTYAALLSLILLGDDLSRIDKDKMTNYVRDLQVDNGSFRNSFASDEICLRFLFAAVSIYIFINREFDFDVNKAVEYIVNNQCYEGGFSYNRGGESHGGATLCAINSLFLMKNLDKIKDKKMLYHWLSNRQILGLNGRINKVHDTCYSYWTGSTLVTLGIFDDVVEKERLVDFILSNCDSRGRFSSNYDSGADGLHTALSIVGLSLCGYADFREIEPSILLPKDFCPGYIKEALSK